MINRIENRYNRLASDIFIFVIGTVLSKAIQFVLMPLYTSYMTTEAYGVAELTNNLSELFFPIATLCIYEAAFRFAVDPEFDNSNLAATAFDVVMKSAIVGALIALIAKYIFQYKYVIYLYFILYSYSFRMTMAYYVRGIGKSKIFAISGIINAIALGFFSILFLVIFHTSESGYLISIGLSYCASALYLVVFGNIPKDIRDGIKTKKNRNVLFQYCTPLIFYNILYWFTTISGRYILNWFSDISTVGKYVAAIKIAAVINMIQQAVYAAFQLNSSRVFSESDKEKYYSEINNIFIIVYFLFGSIIICFTPILAKLTLKNDFYDAKVFLPIIMLGAIINCVSSLLNTMYSTYKKTSRMISVSIIGASINVIVGIILTPIIGIWGICSASVLCYFTQVIYKLYDINKFCKLNYKFIKIIPSFLLLITQVFVMSLEFKYDFIISILLMFFILVINLRDFYNMFREFKYVY